MPSYYTYLISSLPMLHFGMRPPFSFEKFLDFCRGLIPGRDIEIIELAVTSCKGGTPVNTEIATLNKWLDFERALRNELVRILAARRHADPFKYIRADGYTQPYITHIALNAYRNPSILEAERTLDQERWRYLDALAVGHYFDLDYLIVYALKLLLLHRWDKIRSVDKAVAIDESLSQN